MRLFYNKEKKKITGVSLAIILFTLLAVVWLLK